MSMKTSFKHYNMKIKSLMKCKAVRKVELVGLTQNKEIEDDYHYDDE